MFLEMKFKSFKMIKICLMIKIQFLARNFCFKFYFATIFSPLKAFMRKGKNPDLYL
jgi:hypothetical protein